MAPLSLDYRWGSVVVHGRGITIDLVQTISLELPDDLFADLEREAKIRGASKPVVIRESLDSTLRRSSSRPPSCYDLARDLAGSAKGLPRDLAINPKYMDEFG